MNHSDLNWKPFTKIEDLGFILTVFVPLVALCLFACFQSLRLTLVDANWLAVAFFVGPLLLPPILYLTHCRSAFTAATSVMIPLEVLAAFLAQYTLIGLSSLFALLLVWSNLIPVGLQLLQRNKVQIASWILLLLVAITTLVPQAYLGIILLKLESESKRIIAYSYEHKLQTGTFPSDLSGYAWKHGNMRSHFAYFGHGDDDKFTYPFKDDAQYDRGDKFSLRYYVGNRGTAYWYSSKKGWFVEDD